MMLTTKGRYAVMAMVEMSGHDASAPIKLESLSSAQEIAPTYLEQIFAKLKKAGIVSAVRGPGGGYLLARDAGQIYISDIINAVDESIKITRCGTGKIGCMKQGAKCKTHELWEGLGDAIRGYLSGISLADVVKNEGSFQNE